MIIYLRVHVESSRFGAKFGTNNACTIVLKTIKNHPFSYQMITCKLCT